MFSSSDPQAKSSLASETFASNSFFFATPKRGAKVSTVYRELILYLQLTFAYKYFTCKSPSTSFGNSLSHGSIFITIKMLMQDFELATFAQALLKMLL
jgi:hypothetical protein